MKEITEREMYEDTICVLRTGADLLSAATAEHFETASIPNGWENDYWIMRRKFDAAALIIQEALTRLDIICNGSSNEYCDRGIVELGRLISLNTKDNVADSELTEPAVV